MPRDPAETDRFLRLPEPIDPDSLIATQDHSSSPDPDLEAERAFIDRAQG